MPFARASELDRLLKCAGSAWLVRVDTRSNYVKGLADWGNMVHAWKETGTVPKTKAGAALAKKLLKSGVNRETYWPSMGHHEVGLAYNVVSGKALAVTGKPKEALDLWKASFDSEWVTGAADYCSELMDAPWVDDLKTGYMAQYEKYAAQQRFYCMTWAMAKFGRLLETRSTITHWPRYPLGGLPERFGVLITPEEFTLFQTALAELRRHILWAKTLPPESGTALLVPGPQCTYCPSRTGCSAKQEPQETFTNPVSNKETGEL